MKDFLDFLLQLSKHNEKPCFDVHIEEYKAVKAKFDAFAQEFMHGIESFDPRVHGLQLRDITYYH